MLTLIVPDISYKEEWKKIMDEWVDSEKRPTIFFQDSYEDMLERFSFLSLSDDIENTTPKSSFYFLIEKDAGKILGFYWFRHHLNFKNHSQVAGHIGYGIRPSERKKGYARKGLKLVLDEAEKLGYEKIYITCDATNIASEKVIRANGGIFEKFIQNSNHPQEKRYWIPLTNRHVPELLISLEKELLTYDTRHNPKRLDELLADDFFECGKTGSQFGKKECLEGLPLEKERNITTRDMSVSMLSPLIAKVHYFAEIGGEREEKTISFRTSLWRKGESGWQMFFHQGTLIRDNLLLQFPDISHKEAYLLMMEEWRQSEETPTSPGRLFIGDTYEEFLDIIQKDVTDSPRGVNASLFFLMKDEKILGAIQIRHHIKHPDLRESGGHIGYGIRPSMRGQGYATKMLSLGLKEAKKLGLRDVMITCDDDNIASAKVIESTGGIFDQYVEKDGKKLRRYWIHI